MRHSTTLYNAQQGHTELRSVWEFVKPWLIAGHRLTITVETEKRSDKENRLLHAMLGYIAQHQDWAGKKHDAETWKRLLVASWCRAKGEPVEILPALDGCGIDIVFRRTSNLTRGECADLITFIFAWASEQGVHIPADPKQVETTRMLEVA